MEERFSLVKKGYDPAEVHTYIDNLEKTINNYRLKSAAIENAIVNSQIAADNIVKNAELEADKMVRKAKRMLDDINASLNQQKQFVKEFQDDYNNLVNKYVHQFNEQEIQSLHSKITDFQDYMSRLASGVGGEPLTAEVPVTPVASAPANPPVTPAVVAPANPEPQPAPPAKDSSAADILAVQALLTPGSVPAHKKQQSAKSS